MPEVYCRAESLIFDSPTTAVLQEFLRLRQQYQKGSLRVLDLCETCLRNRLCVGGVVFQNEKSRQRKTHDGHCGESLNPSRQIGEYAMHRSTSMEFQLSGERPSYVGVLQRINYSQ